MYLAVSEVFIDILLNAHDLLDWDQRIRSHFTLQACLFGRHGWSSRINAITEILAQVIESRTTAESHG